MKKRSKTTAIMGLFIALAMVLAYVEAILPPLFSAVPGIKIGLANIVIIFLLYRKGALPAAVVSVIRIVLITMLFGNFMSLLYSLAGGFLSLFVMIILKRFNLFSTVGVSVCGAIFHNIGQVLMAMLLLDTTQFAYYLVVLLVTGTIAGVFIGIGGSLLVKRFPQRYIDRQYS